MEINCIICEKTLKILHSDTFGYTSGTMLKDGVEDTLHCGYGSKYDTDEFRIAICDECIDEKIKNGLLKKKDRGY